MPRPKPPRGGSHDILPPLSDAEIAEFERAGGVAIIDADEAWSPPTGPDDNKILDGPTPILEGVLEPPPPKGQVRYESRITIVDAFQYPGNVVDAPDWIDRNWIGYGDYDELRGIEAGPCLRVPNPADPAQVILCRIGDYVARQSVMLDSYSSPILRIDVWSREQFQKIFIPVNAVPHPDVPKDRGVSEDPLEAFTSTLPPRHEAEDVSPREDVSS